MNIQLRKGNFKSYRSHGYVHSIQQAEDWLKDKGEVMEKQFVNTTRPSKSYGYRILSDASEMNH